MDPAGSVTCRSTPELIALLIAAVIMLGGRTLPAAASPAVGQPAPPFTGIDSRGQTISLADYRGQAVVLEWTNHECPFVRRHYDAGSMQALQKRAAREKVVWLSVISSAPGEQGHVTGNEADALTAQRGASPAAVIIDPSGMIGRAYDAKTTPHMFVIDASGTLVYAGAIDDQPRNTGADPATATNHAAEALSALNEGRPVATPVTLPYGCSIKYRSGT